MSFWVVLLLIYKRFVGNPSTINTLIYNIQKYTVLELFRGYKPPFQSLTFSYL